MILSLTLCSSEKLTPKALCVLIAGNHEFSVSHGKRNFSEMIMVIVYKINRLLWVIRMSPIHSHFKMNRIFFFWSQV
jgi:hypothetical protein